MDQNLPPSPPPPPEPPAPPATPPPVPAADAGTGPGDGQEPDIGAYVKRGWDLVAAEPALLIAGYAILAIIIIVSAVVVVGPFILCGPLLVAYYRVIAKLLDGKPAEFGELFAGFDEFGRLAVAGALFCGVQLGVGIILTGLNFVLGHVPCIGSIIGMLLGLAAGVALAGALFFFFPIVAFSAAAPVDALSESMRFAQSNMKPMLLLGLVWLGLALLGSLVCGVGAFVTVPIAMVMQVEAYQRYYLPRAGQTV